MTATNTADKAGSNGNTAATSADGTYERSRGLARVQEEECYHLASLAKNALNEAGYMTEQVYDAGFHRVVHYNDDTGCQPINCAELTQVINEARRCLSVAFDALRLLDNCLVRPDDPLRLTDPWRTDRIEGR